MKDFPFLTSLETSIAKFRTLREAWLSSHGQDRTKAARAYLAALKRSNAEDSAKWDRILRRKT